MAPETDPRYKADFYHRELSNKEKEGVKDVGAREERVDMKGCVNAFESAFSVHATYTSWINLVSKR
ncbi:hypothetical protein NECAME_16313 [Necator americanus]|uniref:Uncharacterized protein n=1 Tax=Necator americanus TaxID=51031 RepID=W2TXB9_NECAM|nr:hypothetical protein NECAME_16313 [Necator americanus]ETN86483.1 hypothetical protein NECAME_16313 [Necator americanus]